MRDAATWHRLRRDNAAWLGPWEATLPTGDGLPLASYRQMVRALRKQARQGQSLPFVVTHEGKMVGQLTVNGITWGSARWASVGYWISKSHAGRSITPVALALACDHLLGSMRLHRVEVAIRPENSASLRVVEKLGFTEFGLAPRYLHISGVWADHRLFQVTAEERHGRMVDRLTPPVAPVP